MLLFAAAMMLLMSRFAFATTTLPPSPPDTDDGTPLILSPLPSLRVTPPLMPLFAIDAAIAMSAYAFIFRYFH